MKKIKIVAVLNYVSDHCEIADDLYKYLDQVKAIMNSVNPNKLADTLKRHPILHNISEIIIEHNDVTNTGVQVYVDDKLVHEQSNNVRLDLLDSKLTDLLTIED